jgi:hypothetical protein
MIFFFLEKLQKHLGMGGTKQSNLFLPTVFLKRNQNIWQENYTKAITISRDSIVNLTVKVKTEKIRISLLTMTLFNQKTFF